MLLAGVLLASFLSALAGCGPGKPTFMSFMGKSSKSAEEMKPIVGKLKKKFKGKVAFVDVDMDDKENKGIIAEYHVSMNPTFIIKNAQGQIKETFMGAAQEEMLSMALEGFIPSTSKPPSSATGAMPQSTPVTPSVPPPSSSVQPVPSTPTP